MITMPLFAVSWTTLILRQKRCVVSAVVGALILSQIGFDVEVSLLLLLATLLLELL